MAQLRRIRLGDTQTRIAGAQVEPSRVAVWVTAALLLSLSLWATTR